jgi:methylphosphotriester-DNA--protein-cysteine methyltransferase
MGCEMPEKTILKRDMGKTLPKASGVVFASKAEAERAGYRKAKNCPGERAEECRVMHDTM